MEKKRIERWKACLKEITAYLEKSESERLKPPEVSPKRWLLETKRLTWGEFLRMPNDKRKALLDEYRRLCEEYSEQHK